MPSARYLTHRPLVFWQKALLAVTSGIASAVKFAPPSQRRTAQEALFSPYRADLVAASNETLGEGAFRRIYESMLERPQGKRILKEKPRITAATLEQCRQMKEGSFGAAYATFMDHRHLSPTERPPVRFIDDPEVAYVATRYREVHDLWHVLTGCSTNMVGEIAVKTVEGIQTGLPNAILAALLSPMMIQPRDREWFFTTMLPWAIKSGFNATDLMSIYYEDHFEESLREVRHHWCLTPAPQPSS